jgi:hypothetical protein
MTDAVVAVPKVELAGVQMRYRRRIARSSHYRRLLLSARRRGVSSHQTVEEDLADHRLRYRRSCTAA